MATTPTKNTVVYIDSFNLYYGALRGTPYKWLDLREMVRQMIKPHHQITQMRIFTATPIPRPGDLDVAARQSVYFRALRAHIPGIEFIEGRFLEHPVWMRSTVPDDDGKFPTVQVVKSEEKGSDVNLAVHLLNDAWRGAFDAAIVVSNDSDLAEAIKLTRALHKVVGVLAPVRKPGVPRKRKVSHQLRVASTFLREIGERAITRSVLPSPIPGTNIHKPDSW